MSSSPRDQRSLQITMLRYYERRQPEYEAIYAKPERQPDLLWLEEQLCHLVADKRVLEIACGTGYWTRRMAKLAASIHATDMSHTLAAAARASCGHGAVTAGVVDAFNVPASPGVDCLVAGFFLSHVLIARRPAFFGGLAKALDLGVRLVLFDNRYVPGSSTPISRRSKTGDTYQQRQLADSSAHEVIKNFPVAGELSALLAHYCSDVEVLEREFFWLATGMLNS
ncbi:MAG: class I SAM-dependent methyltransferase [Leptolyngbyaceae cyanobacterium]